MSPTRTHGTHVLALAVQDTADGPAWLGWPVVLRRRVRSLLRRGYALTLAVRDERTPLKAKVVALVVLAWVVSPVDFDFVPLLGWVDDALVVALGARVVERLSPIGLFGEFESKAPRRLRWVVLGLALVALLVLLVTGYVVWRLVI